MGTLERAKLYVRSLAQQQFSSKLDELQDGLGAAVLASRRLIAQSSDSKSHTKQVLTVTTHEGRDVAIGELQFSDFNNFNLLIIPQNRVITAKNTELVFTLKNGYLHTSRGALIMEHLLSDLDDQANFQLRDLPGFVDKKIAGLNGHSLRMITSTPSQLNHDIDTAIEFYAKQVNTTSTEIVERIQRAQELRLSCGLRDSSRVQSEADVNEIYKDLAVTMLGLGYEFIDLVR